MLKKKIIDLIVPKRTKKSPSKWIVKKHESQVDELDQLKLKTVFPHDDHNDEIHRTQLVAFVATDLIQLMVKLSGVHLEAPINTLNYITINRLYHYKKTHIKRLVLKWQLSKDSCIAVII